MPSWSSCQAIRPTSLSIPAVCQTPWRLLACLSGVASLRPERQPASIKQKQQGDGVHKVLALLDFCSLDGWNPTGFALSKPLTRIHPVLPTPGHGLASFLGQVMLSNRIKELLEHIKDVKDRRKNRRLRLAADKKRPQRQIQMGLLVLRLPGDQREKQTCLRSPMVRPSHILAQRMFTIPLPPPREDDFPGIPLPCAMFLL